MIRARPSPHLLVVLVLAALFYFAFTQRFPYHIDTVGYVEGAKDYLATGVLPRTFDRRLLNIYCYVPFLWLAGEAGIKALSIGVILAFSAFYFLLLEREFGRRVAFVASLLMLSAPATIITVTHL